MTLALSAAYNQKHCFALVLLLLFWIYSDQCYYPHLIWHQLASTYQTHNWRHRKKQGHVCQDRPYSQRHTFSLNSGMVHFRYTKILHMFVFCVWFYSACQECLLLSYPWKLGWNLVHKAKYLVWTPALKHERWSYFWYWKGWRRQTVFMHFFIF